MRVDRVIFVLVVLATVGAVAYVYFGTRALGPFEAREVRANDPLYIQALAAIKRDDPAFLIAAHGRTTGLAIGGEKANCVLVVMVHQTAYNGSDYIYCFDKQTGAPLGRI